MKLRNPRSIWAAAFYLFAPNPFSVDSPYRGFGRLKGFFYWLFQIPAYRVIKYFADVIMVTSQPDVEKFVTHKRDSSKVIIVRGGVTVDLSNKTGSERPSLPLEARSFDACFIGRFHEQKGVLLLIDIWKTVCLERPTAKLVLIGGGPLEEAVMKKIKETGLEGNVALLGYITDPVRKSEIFRNSRLVVHPAIYDSGGMAAAEAMAWGLPGVSFDLEALKTYYPKGMVKTPCFDLNQFAANILKLLADKDYYAKMSKEAHDLIVEEWDWDKRAATIINTILQ